MSELPSSVLFACTLNSVRSPMAEALAKRYYGRRAYFDSAGVRAGDLDGFTVSVLDEVGVDIHRHTVKTLDEIDPSEFELIITLSPEAHHAALELTRDAATQVEYWPTPDPSVIEDDRMRRLEAYRQVRDMLGRRMRQRFGASGAVEV
ncbi:low molecular weight phosphatase family protein [Vineibacter terrae]|uniref:Low molecular weight phosphatase family protein n=1 Tax=Vineibacter terrae TaxID=2586908 RepID=A0A5C8PR58_9HYPH|nr:low molecular weight phosphatase family protein [Vineibacter terrae]TXL77673.1 low molecular weight phosphatase family protein [Vineibacter terrae]